MKDIYSPLEIDEEWDNYSPMADGIAIEERSPKTASTNILVSSSDVQTPPAAVLGAEEFKMPASNVMPGIDSNNSGTQESSQPDIAYTAAVALIDKPATDADLVTTPRPAATNGDTFDISDTSSSPTPDTSGLVSITPGETTPETPTDDTSHEIAPVKINVTGDKTPEETPEETSEETSEETPDSNDTLPDPIDQSNGGTSSPDVPGEEPEEEPKGDSDVVIDTGTISPDTIKASDDDGGESSDDNVENRESATADDTDDTESDTAGSLSEVKADKAKVENKDTAPASGGTTIEEFKSNLYKTLDTLGEERSETLASIEAGEKEKQKCTDDYNEKMAAINDRNKAYNEKLTVGDKYIAQLESLK